METGPTDGRPRLRLTVAATMLVDEPAHDPNRRSTSSVNIVAQYRRTQRQGSASTAPRERPFSASANFVVNFVGVE